MPDIGKDFLGISSVAKAEQFKQQALESQRTAASDGLTSARSLDNRAHPTKAQQIDKASRQFEALLLQQMLKSMWDTVPQSDLYGGGNEAAMYRDMFNEALAESISKGKGLGVKDLVAKDLSRIDGYKDK